MGQNPKNSETQIDHTQIRKEFVDVLNLVQPTHPYYTNPYPVDTDEIKYGYKKASSSLYASCGPCRKFDGTYNVVSFSADKQKFNSIIPDRRLAIYTHELTHITVGSHSTVEKGSHPPRFWREFGYYAHILLDCWDSVQEVIDGEVTKRGFIGKIVSEEVNPSNIDRRYTNTIDQRHQMSLWFRKTIA